MRDAATSTGHLKTAAWAFALLALPACAFSPLRQIPPRLPTAVPGSADQTNAGRVQSIAISPIDRRRAVIAMQFGGLWRTFNGGDTWFRIYTLPTVFATDVEFGGDGKTVVATVFRDNKSTNGGGIYVSRDGGDFWNRPPTGAIPTSTRTPLRTSAYSVSRAPDERGLWYAGTDFGVAVTKDDGATWTHVRIDASIPLEDDRKQDAAQSVLAFPGGVALALTRTGLYRSNDRGAQWTKILTDNFRDHAPSGAGGGMSGNKMDRSPFSPWAFIFKNFGGAGGTLWFYELDSGTTTALPLPQGRYRGPFVRVSRDTTFGDGHISVWVGEGWDGYFVTRKDAASIRAIRADAEHNDWVSFIAPAGIHADLGDLGLDADLQPVLVGSDGGIFKPDPARPGKWLSAAAPGSGMNSLQISDLGGTNVMADDRRITTSLYFTTQDNRIWASPDGGNTWPRQDFQEGFGIETRSDARTGETLTVGYVAIGMHLQAERFAGLNLINQRAVPNVDQNGAALTGLKMAFFLGQRPGGFPSHWLRLRPVADSATTEAFLSENGGSNWRKRGEINFAAAGHIKPTVGGAFAWLPVFTGEAGPDMQRIGLVFVAPYPDPLEQSIPVYDDSDVVRLPNGGSLGRRATEFDWHAVFGAHPLDWRYLIAPDIAAGNIKVSRDGGVTWQVDQSLTKHVLRNGAFKLWDGDVSHMQVTTIAFDTLRWGRILVGTRDAGIVCSENNGLTWRTIKDSDQINYITGFHFHPSGAVYISSYGHGLWYLKPASGCSKTYDFPWDSPPVADPRPEDVQAKDVPPPKLRPRGIADPNRPKVFVSTTGSGSGVAVLGSDNLVSVSGRNFPASADLLLTIPEAPAIKVSARSDGRGRFSTSLRIPDDLPPGHYAIEVRQSGAADRRIGAEFIKGFTDEKPASRR